MPFRIGSDTWGIDFDSVRTSAVTRLTMTGHNEGTIAALLRHSTTALVTKRYAHLSPSHLKAAVEGVSGFGKAPEAVRESQIPAGESKPVSNGTVTETGMVGSAGEKSGVEVCARCGAGDPD